jgi:hypothetical protein
VTTTGCSAFKDGLADTWTEPSSPYFSSFHCRTIVINRFLCPRAARISLSGFHVYNLKVRRYGMVTIATIERSANRGHGEFLRFRVLTTTFLIDINGWKPRLEAIKLGSEDDEVWMELAQGLA